LAFVEHSVTIPSELIKSREMDLQFVFSTYGVTVRVESNDPDLLEKARRIAKKSFIERLEFVEGSVTAGYTFGLKVCGRNYQLFENGSYRSETESEKVFLNFFTSYLRAIVAERATPWVFVHAGAIGRNGKVAIFPGNSYSGKTSLVAELLRRGADYYSDEYAVIGDDGLVYPFPRQLSVRMNGDRGTVREFDPEAFGDRGAAVPAELGLVIITKYEPGAAWKPERLEVGTGIMATLPHVIPIRFNTAGSMRTLNIAFENAIILRGDRGDAARDAETMLAMMDSI
jgi:hypothetical protein